MLPIFLQQGNFLIETNLYKIKHLINLQIFTTFLVFPKENCLIDLSLISVA
jgi:hypothetical protein